MSANDHHSNDPGGSSDDNRHTLPDDLPPAVIITGHQIQCWAGRALTSGELARLEARIATSPIPQLIAQIIAQVDNKPINESAVLTRRRINYHRDDAGDWCPWSLTALAATANGRCPGGCANSTVEADDGDDEPHNLTDCQLCGAPGGYPYCAGTFGSRMSCAEAVELDDSAEPPCCIRKPAGARPGNTLRRQRHPRSASLLSLLSSRPRTAPLALLGANRLPAVAPRPRPKPRTACAASLHIMLLPSIRRPTVHGPKVTVR